MPPETIDFRVFRQGGEDPAPRFDTYRVAIRPRTTVLEALRSIHLDQDRSLSLRYSCFHASCGTCGMRINGVERLACVTNVKELGNSEVVVEPLGNARVITDLVVDMDGFYRHLAPFDRPLIRRSEIGPGGETPVGIEEPGRLENCIECGLCVSACPITATDPRYLGPAALSAAHRVVSEPRGRNVDKVLATVDDRHGCWRCHVSFECTEACPSDVFPAEAIMALRGTLLRRHLVGSKRARSR